MPLSTGFIHGASVYMLHVGVRSACCTLRLELHRGCYHMMVAPFLLNVALPHSCLQQQRELRVAVRHVFVLLPRRELRAPTHALCSAPYATSPTAARAAAAGKAQTPPLPDVSWKFPDVSGSFRKFLEVPGSSWKFPEVSGRSFPDVSGRLGEGGAALQGPPEMGRTPRHAPPDREPRPTVHDSRDRSSAARTDLASFRAEGVSGAHNYTRAHRVDSHAEASAAAAAWVIRTAAGRTCRTTRCRLNSDLLIDPACTATPHPRYSWVLGYEYPRVLPSYLGAC
jgi:hypothetical protein